MRILHLSDLHFADRTSWDADPVVRGLTADAAEHARDVDLLVITGDVAYSGKAQEYALARVWLDDLLCRIGLSADRVVLVRGNHDVDRGLVGAAGELLIAALYHAGDEEQAKILRDDEARALLLRPARAWSAFAAAYGSPTDRTWGPRCFDVAGQRVHVAVLDSGLPCVGDVDAAPAPPLFMVREALAGSEGAALVLVATHHPIPEGASCLAPVRRAAATLRGHLHAPDPHFVVRPTGQTFELASGSAYAGSKWRNAYAVLTFDAAGLTVSERRWEPAHEGWEAGRTWTQAAPRPALAPRDRLRAEIRRRALELPWLSGSLGRDVTVLDDVVVEVEVQGAHTRAPLREVIAPERFRGRLEGEPGSGKSTMLARLAVQLLDEGTWLPVILHAELALTEPDPLRLIEQDYPGSGAAARSAGATLVLLVDGVDEVPGKRKDIADALARWSRAVPDARVIFAGRPHGSVDLPGFPKLTLCPLEPAARQRLMERLGVPVALARSTLRTMAEDGARMAEMAGNPLLLTLAAFVLKEGGSLPRTRAALYEAMIERRFHREQVNPAAPPLNRPTEVREVVEDVVLARFGSDRWTQAELVDAVKKAPGWKDLARDYQGPDGFLGEVARESELLVKVGAGWGVPHRTVREFLAACALHRRGVTDDDLKRAVADEARWAEVFALLAARLGAGAEALLVRLRALGAPAKPLVWKVLADAEGLPADVVVQAVGLTGGRKDWATRMGTLAKLPELLLGRLDLVVDVCERLARILLHGAEAWQLRELVLGVADGSLKGSYGPNRGGAAQTLVQRRARVLVDGILLLHPERGVGVRDAVRAALEWRLVPAGRSWIGAHPDDSGSYPDEKPGRWVEITRSVDMTRDPITNAAYERFDPGHADERHTSADQPDAEEHPVVLVSWFEAAAFAAWLGEGARLPDEVVWEHACRAGTVTPYWSGANEADLAAVGWYKKNSRGRTHAVDDLPPRGRQHPFGLRHLHGNVREWTASWWTSDHAGLGAQHDPELPPDRPPAGRRVIRGGTWWNVPRDCRSAYRDGWRPSDRFDDLGFRLVRLPASCTAIDR